MIKRQKYFGIFCLFFYY